jgi:hypothetical protein
LTDGQDLLHVVREVQRLVVAPAVVVDQRAEEVHAQVPPKRRPLRLLHRRSAQILGSKNKS